MNKFTLTYIGLAALVLFLLAVAASAHEAKTTSGSPLGWKYSIACCSNKDCAPIDGSAVQSTKHGWLVLATGEVIAYGSSKLKDSPDGTFHRCTYGGSFSPEATTRCLYVPPMGF